MLLPWIVAALLLARVALNRGHIIAATAYKATIALARKRRFRKTAKAVMSARRLSGVAALAARTAGAGGPAAQGGPPRAGSDLEAPAATARAGAEGAGALPLLEPAEAPGPVAEAFETEGGIGEASVSAEHADITLAPDGARAGSTGCFSGNWSPRGLPKKIRRAVLHWALTPYTEDEMLELQESHGAAMCLALSWLYFSLTSTLVDYFDCVEAKGRWSLSFEPATECWNFSEWTWWPIAFVLALFCIILYPVGIFCFFMHMLRKHRVTMRSRGGMRARARFSTVRRKMLGKLASQMGAAAVSKEEEEALQETSRREAVLRKQIGFLYRRYNTKFF